MPRQKPLEEVQRPLRTPQRTGSVGGTTRKEPGSGDRPFGTPQDRSTTKNPQTPPQETTEASNRSSSKRGRWMTWSRNR